MNDIWKQKPNKNQTKTNLSTTDKSEPFRKS